MRFKKMHPDAALPTRAHPGDAGLDLSVIVETSTGFVDLWPGETRVFRSGLAVEIPHGYVGLIRPRSRLFRDGLDSDGVIDAGYRGEIGIGLRNTRGSESVRVANGERVVQLLVVPVMLTDAYWADELSETERGVGGFGSTGK